MTGDYKTQSIVGNGVSEGFGFIEIIHKEWRFGIHHLEGEGLCWTYAGREHMDCGVFSEETIEHLKSMIAGERQGNPE